MKTLLFYFSSIIIVALILIQIFRASNIGMTSDECYSYTRYVNEPYINIITYIDIIILPNNHIFNTVGMKFFSSILGISPLVLRLTNLLAFCCYCAVFLYWLKNNASHLYYIPITIILFFNPYILDFFMLARGYGLGMCLMMISIFLIDRLRSKREISRQDYYLPLSMAALSVWANFAFLNFYLAFVAVIEAIIIYQYQNRNKDSKRPSFISQHKPIAVVTTVLFIAIFWPMFQIIKAHQLYGGMDGFWQNTVQSLIARTIYEATYPAWVTLAANAIIVFSIVGFTLAMGYSLIKRRAESLLNPLFHAGVLLLVPAILNISEHHLFNTEFPEDRTAVFYIVLYLYFVIRLLQFKNSVLTGLALYGFAFIFTINVCINLSFDYVWEWKYDINTGKMMSELKNRLPECSNISQNVNLGCNPLFEPSISYYRLYLKMNCIHELDRDGLVKGVSYDYVYALKNDPRFKKPEDCKVINQYPVSETELLQLK